MPRCAEDEGRIPEEPFGTDPAEAGGEAADAAPSRGPAAPAHRRPTRLRLTGLLPRTKLPSY